MFSWIINTVSITISHAVSLLSHELKGCAFPHLFFSMALFSVGHEGLELV